MCHLCEERAAYADTVIDVILETHQEYRAKEPGRTQGQRISDLANVFLSEMPVGEGLSPETVACVQDIALFLAAMTERVMDLKREQHVSDM